MKGISKFTLVVVLIILSLVVLSLMMDGQRIQRSMETMEGGNKTEELEKRIELLELSDFQAKEELSKIEANHNNFVKSLELEKQRTIDLLNKTDGLETIYGVIDSLSGDRQKYINIKEMVKDSEGEYSLNDRASRLVADNDFTPYMFTEIGLTALSQEEFLSFIEDEIANESEEIFTFKVIKGKIVQIYQGMTNN